MPKRTRDHESWLIEKLTDTERASNYLNAARQDSQEMFFEALRDVAQARQMSKVAKDAGVTRESLYKVTSGAGNPTYGTFDSVLEALGLDFIIKPRVPRTLRPMSVIASGRKTSRSARVRAKKTLLQEFKIKRGYLESLHSTNAVLGGVFNHLFGHSGSQTGSLPANYAYTNPRGNAVFVTLKNSAEPLLPAYLSSELLHERKYGRQDSAGNNSPVGN